MFKLNLDTINKVQEFHDPYPMIIYSNLLGQDQLNNLQNSLSEKETIFDKTYMGNRKTILKGTENFTNFIDKNSIANEINNFFDQKEVFNYFYKNLDRLNKNNNNYFDFKNKKFKYLKNFISRKKNIFFKIKNKSSKLLSLLFRDCRIYCDFDFSVAGTGYEREAHHDKEDRILNFLFYINDFDQTNGGNFQIFKYKNNPELYLRQPSIDECYVLNKIKPKKGCLVTFLSTPNSLHGVEIINSTSEKRYFFYGSYTSIKKINWKLSKKN